MPSILTQMSPKKDKNNSPSSGSSSKGNNKKSSSRNTAPVNKGYHFNQQQSHALPLPHQYSKDTPASVPANNNKKMPKKNNKNILNNGLLMADGERAKADASISSTSVHWYAGAAFDRAPPASSLPLPTKLVSLQKSPSSMSLNNNTKPADQSNNSSLSTSCPSTTTDLKAHSRNLLEMLRQGERDAAAGTKDSGVHSSSGNHDLDEMTRQVRRLLNIP